MSLRIRRGTNSQRTGITFDLGEIVYTTDTQKLYIGDGVTAGGKNILETSAGNGFTFNPTTQQIDFAIGNLNLNTAQVSESSNLYFTTERAQDAVGAALVAGNAFNTGVTFTYDDANNRITAVATGSAGLTTVSSDTNPSLGGNLSTGAFNISGNGSVTTGTITATNLGGNLSTGAFNISGTGSITAGTITATTGLGANLFLNGKNILGTGGINYTGSFTNGALNISTSGIISGLTVFDVGSADGKNVTINPQANANPGLNIKGISPFTAQLAFSGQRGTTNAPLLNQAGDSMGQIQFRSRAITNPVSPSDGYATVTGMFSTITDMGNGVTIAPTGKLCFVVINPDTPDNLATAYLSEFSKPGVWTAPSFLSTSKSTGAGIGYGTGAGSVVTQTTSRTTGVTINAPCGRIILTSDATTNGQVFSFTVTNSFVANSDVVQVSVRSGTGIYYASVTATATGSFQISVCTYVEVVLAEAPQLNFVVIKSVVA